MKHAREGKPTGVSIRVFSLTLVSIYAAIAPLRAAETEAKQIESLQTRVQELHESLNFLEARLAKRVNDLMWFQRLGDLAEIDVVRFTGPPARVTNNPSAQGAGNPLIIPAYTFVPKKFASLPGRLPLLILVHGGVHGDVSPEDDLRIVRELLDQGYIIMAPEYRGSSGYGRDYYEQIDYGGRENDDVLAARDWIVENNPKVDSSRVGILGWSHGGMIALMNIFDHPNAYQVAYAGVPVSDLIARMGYKNEGYRKIFAAKEHLGKTAEEDVAEYRRRSPVWNAEKLQTPLLIHSTTNDEDVNVLEVEHLIQALKAAGKSFESKIYTNAPGGHAFNRIDTSVARDSRTEVYRFLARYLQPPGAAR